MPERDYDRLEQFFRKAAAKADVTFNDEDWKKLEARLDAAPGGAPVVGRSRGGLAITAVVGTILLVSTAVWISSGPDTDPAGKEVKTTAGLPSEALKPAVESPENPTPAPQTVVPNGNRPPVPSPLAQSGQEREATSKPLVVPNRIEIPDRTKEGAIAEVEPQRDVDVRVEGRERLSGVDEKVTPTTNSDAVVLATPSSNKEISGADQVSNEPDRVEKNKQKAVVELPGAEESETREAQAMVNEEHASDTTKLVAVPRLSLLLSFAPDFSGTSVGVSSSPGKAFGVMLHYHFFDRWSVSAGVVKNDKQYQCSGDDYNAPKSYWKYYTNGVVPETIDGSCSILEFPLMIQYTAFQSSRSKWNVALGASSYLMESESYRYHFNNPNPGAREGWNSRSSTRFYFNMVNIAVGYERQVLPGLMLGIEPYAKVPLQEIGWLNLKLFSSGISVTARYTILRRQTFHMPARSRGPD